LIAFYGTENISHTKESIGIIIWLQKRHYAFVDKNSVKPKASLDARNVIWYDVKALPLLAFDHQLIIEDALQRARKNKEIK